MLLSVATADAVPFTFFGQDPGPNDDSARLSSHATADGAQTQFFNALSSRTTVTLEGLAGGTTVVPFTFGAVNGTITGGPGVATKSIPTGTDTAGGYPISGNVLWAMETTSSFTITLNQAVTGIGFYGVDIGDAGGQLSVALNGGAASPVALTSNDSGNVLYFGLIDPANPFNKITILNSDPSADRFNFDDFTVGVAAEQDLNLAATPEPATLLLLGTSLAGMAGAAWKRRRAGRAAD